MQKLDRDTQKCAFKCSYACVDGKEIDVSKTPIHSPDKKSKAGMMTVNKRDNTIVTLCGSMRDENDDILKTVFLNGDIIKEYSWEEVKENSKIKLENLDRDNISNKMSEFKMKYINSLNYLRDVDIMRRADSSFHEPYKLDFI